MSNGAKTLKDKVFRNGIGYCPVTHFGMSGNKLLSLIDTGSVVSTVSEQYYDTYLKNKVILEDTSDIIKVKAANQLNLPYLGYFEIDIDYLGTTIPDVGFLVTTSLEDEIDFTGNGLQIQGIMGNNFIDKVHELVTPYALG